MLPSLAPEPALVAPGATSPLSTSTPSVLDEAIVDMPHETTSECEATDTLSSTTDSQCHDDWKLQMASVDATDFNLINVINAVRVLTADAVENAISGHPGMPLGMAPAACVLWNKHLKFNPVNPAWINRDRFVLSAGHGCMLQYALMYLHGYDSMTIDDIRNFRSPLSRATGHPENSVTRGVEVTTGALGQGICNAVGIALAESHLASIYNREDAPALIDHYTYCIVGDGCLMEGIASEACSLAGHWRLGKLIVLYDDNKISIDGSTDLAFTEDVVSRFRAYRWHCLEVLDGDHDLRSIDLAIEEAKSVKDMPSLIKVRTTIGYGAPTKSGTKTAHGSCLGADEIEGLRNRLSWICKPFEIPDDVLVYTRQWRQKGIDLEREWNSKFIEFHQLFPEAAGQFEKLVIRQELPANWTTSLDIFLDGCGRNKRIATRTISRDVLNAIADKLPNLVGGSADLASSTLAVLEKSVSFQHDQRSGRVLHFGVREHGMAAISNAIALYNGGLIPFCSTFLVFSDYCRAAIRTAALSKAGVIFILSHDSVLLGEDGPTHQPVEHLASFRAMPGIFTFRPADVIEVAICYELAIERRRGPSLMVLSRQEFECPAGSASGTRRGGYVHSENKQKVSSDVDPDLIYIATGSEVALASAAAEKLRLEGAVVNVVSMPCMELFELQPRSYRRSVLPKSVPLHRRIVVEAGSQFGWHKYASHFHTVDDFGVSGNEDAVRNHFGLTVEALVRKSRFVILSDSDSSESE